MTEASFSTNELFLRSDRIAFGKIPPEVLVREERTIILPDTTGQRLFIGLSTLVSTNTFGNLDTIYPEKASFTFDLLNNKFGIGVSSPQYSLDIQTTTGLRLSGGSLIANAFGLFSVQTQALISTLPTSVFAPGTIPVTALASSGTSILAGISVPTTALYGTLAASLFANSTISLLSLQSTGTIYATQFIGGGAAITGLSLANINTSGIENLFSVNTLSLSTLASTGQIWLRDGSIISPYISTGTLYTNTLFPTTISTGSIVTGTLLASSFTVASFTASTVSSMVIETGILRASQIYGDGYMITNLNPANITGTLPPERYGYRTISFDAINPYGNFLVQAGTVTLNAPTTASNVVIQGTLTGSNIASFSSMVYASSFQGDGYNLSNLNVPNWENLKSTVAGLGSAGYISSLAAITKELLTSSIIGLGTVGYVSTASLVSTTAYLLENSGGLSMTSTTVGLGTLGYVSTASLVSTTAYLLENSGGLSMTSTTVGLGTLGYVSTASLVSTTAYLLENSGGLSMTSTTVGLGTLGYVSTASLVSTTAYLLENSGGASMTSTTVGLGTLGYVSTASLVSTTAYLLENSGGLSMTSTTVGLGTLGYVSTASLVSTTTGLLGQSGSNISSFSTAFGSGGINTAALLSSVIGLGSIGYISSAQLLSTTVGVYTYISSFVDPTELTSTIVGLGTFGYVSTMGLLSTASGLASYITTFIDPVELASTVAGLGSASFISTLQLNLTLTSTVQGLGSAGYVSTTGNPIYNDSWITTNLINPPSSLIFGTPISKSSQIFIPWTYPTQTNVGFQSSWLPVINNFNTIISTNIVSINSSTIISTLSTGYVNYHNSSNYITGIVLAKIKGTSGIQSITFPQDGLQRSAYIYYEPSLSSISTSGQLTAWYGNYNVGSNVVSTIFTPFVAPGAPSVPQKLQSTNVTSNSLSFYFSTPQFVDVNDPTSVATITQYDLSFNSIPIPGLRYGTVQCNAQAPTITTPFTFVASPDSSAGQVIQYAAANLFPDSTYRFYVKAKNSGGLYGPQASTLGISTSYLTPATVTGPSFTSRYYSGTVKRASDNTTITTLVNTNTDWTSANFIVPVQTVAARGSQAIGIIAISTFFTTPSTIRGPTVFTNGFPASLPSSLTQSSMTVSTTNVYDNYAASITAYQGFYLNTSNNVTIKNSIFKPNSTIYTFNTVSYQSTSAGVTSNQTQQTFHYDGSPGTATITDLTFNYATSPAPTNNYVSGVRVISGTPQFSTITGASNLGQWFYVSPIVTLSNTIDTTVTSLTNTNTTNVISGFSNGQFLPATRVVFSNALTANSLATTFASSIKMTAVCSNVTMTSAQITATNISSIIDGPSVTLIGTTLPAVLQTLNSGTPATGCRIWSFSSFDTSNIYVPPYIFGCNGTNYSYTNYLYDTATFHSYSLVDAAAPFPLVKELQVVNGYHVTKGTRKDCYINYTNMKYNATSVNNTDYSVITTSGIRFATFGWMTASSGTNYSALSFTITYSSAASSPLSLSNNLVIFTGTAEKLYVFYKVEDQVSLLPTNGTSATSVWLDANGTLGTTASALTYFVDSTGNYTQIRGGVTSGATSNATSFTFPNVFIPSFATIGKDVRIFCRIGIPMNYNFAFTTISATLS